MAHEITFTDRFGEVRSTGKRAWHGLGLEIAPGLTANEALPLIGLDWTTELKPVYVLCDRDKDIAGNFISSSQFVPIESHRAHVRTDNQQVLGVVGKDYQPLQNYQLAELADVLVHASDGKATVETAGSLRGGRRVFVLLNLPDKLRATSEDWLEPYVLLCNGNGGTASFLGCLVTVRVVCANTLNLAETGFDRRGVLSKGFRFAHVGNFQDKLNQARTLLGLATEEARLFQETIDLLVGTTLNPRQLSDYFDNVYAACFGRDPEGADKSTIDKFRKHRYDSQEQWYRNLEGRNQNLPGIEGTVWAALNAVTEWNDHQRGKVGDQTDARAHSNLLGVSAHHKAVALQGALRLV